MAQRILFYFSGIFLLITKSCLIESISADILELSRSEQNASCKISIIFSGGSEIIVENNSQSIECKLTNYAKTPNGHTDYYGTTKTINVIDKYFKVGFQIILLILFGIVIKETKIKAVIRNTNGLCNSLGISAFCKWIVAPLVSVTLCQSKT